MESALHDACDSLWASIVPLAADLADVVPSDWAVCSSCQLGGRWWWRWCLGAEVGGSGAVCCSPVSDRCIGRGGRRESGCVYRVHWYFPCYSPRLVI